MNLFIFSDESGVFDKEHNQYYVYGGLIFVGKEEQDIASRKYINAENVVRGIEGVPGEVKASVISNKSKGKLYRSLNAYEKFGIVIEESRVLERIYKSKKDKQRYLDFEYKIGVKAKLMQMIRNGIIVPDDVDHLYFFIDEHTTATNGRYELREALEQEFKYGTYNWNYSVHFPSIFPNLQGITLSYCNSASKTLVRAADIVANKVYHLALEDALESIENVNNMLVIIRP